MIFHSHFFQNLVQKDSFLLFVFSSISDEIDVLFSGVWKIFQCNLKSNGKFVLED